MLVYAFAIILFSACSRANLDNAYTNQNEMIILPIEIMEVTSKEPPKHAMEASSENKDIEDTLILAQEIAILESSIITLEELLSESYRGFKVLHEQMYLDWIGSFHDNMARVSANGTNGFLNLEDGSIFIYEFNAVDNFSYGLARVSQNDKYGFIDKNGNIVVPLEYDGVGTFSDGMAWVRKGDKYGYIDTTGNLVIPLIFDVYFDWYLWFGEPVFEGIKLNMSNFSNGRAVVRVDGKVGFIDRTGKLVIPAIYDGNFWDAEWSSYSPRFNNGFAVIRKDGKFGMIDMYGNIIIPFIYDRIACQWTGTFSEFPIRVSRDGKWGFVDEDGKVVIPLQYGLVMPFSNGLAAVNVMAFEIGWENSWGFIDTTGELVLPFEYNIGDQWEGWFAFDNRGFLQTLGNCTFSTIGLVDINGEMILPNEFASIHFITDNLICAVKVHTEIRENEWGQRHNVTILTEYLFFDTYGNEVTIFDDYQEFFRSHWGPSVYNELVIIGKYINGIMRYGVIDTKGNIVLPIIFRSISGSTNGLFQVKWGDFWGVLEVVD